MIKKATTCVYAISLNEIKHVDSFMAANREADLVLVCDTGSTDGTPERLRELGAIVYDIVQKPWRFDVPRNTALSLIPNDIDFCLSIDLDEYLQPGWNDALQEEWKKHDGNMHRIAYDYVWNWKEDGITPDIEFYADKIHHRKGYRWRHPCHETLYWEGDGEEIKVTIPKLILHHRADNLKSRGQYLPLLKMAVEEDPNNDRMSHYYGRELMYHSHHNEAIKELERHLSLPSSQWKEERCSSLRFISRCQRAVGQLNESLHSAIKAVLEWPHSREPWLELARSAYAINDWHTCYWAATKCLNIKQKTMSYIGESICWGAEPYDLAGIAAYQLGLYSEAIKFGKTALELEPNDLRLKKNVEFYNEKVSSN